MARYNFSSEAIPGVTNYQRYFLKESDSVAANFLMLSRINYNARAYEDIPGYFNDRYSLTIKDRATRYPLYGVSDRYGNTIDPIIGGGNITQIPGNPSKMVFGHKLATNLFFQMKEYYDLARRMNKLVSQDGPYSTLIARSGFSTGENEYKQYMVSFFKIFHKVLNNSELKHEIFNFKKYLELFFIFIDTLDNPAVTYSKFLKTSYSTGKSSGLVIDVFAGDNANDLEKYEQFIADKNFIFFIECCARFGFLINKSMPWQIYVNLDSLKTLEEIRKIEKNTTSDKHDIFSKTFRKSYTADIDLLKTSLLASYKEWLELAFQKTANEKIKEYTGIDSIVVGSLKEINHCGEALIEENKIESMDIKTLNALFDDLYWINKYFNIKLKEEKIKITNSFHEALETEIRDIYNTSGNTAALNRVNLFVISNTQQIDINKTVNY